MIAEEYLQQAELFRSTETIFGVVTEGDHNCPYELHFNIQAISNYIEIQSSDYICCLETFREVFQPT